MSSNRVFVFLLVITTVTFFIFGARIQHDVALLHLHKLIQTDPYAFHLRDKIYGAFKMFRFRKEDLPKVAISRRTPISDIMKHGFPGLDCLIAYSDFMLSFDRRNRVAHWVYEHITTDSLKDNNKNVRRRQARYLPDFSVPSLFRPDSEDYKKSGYERGHLAASGNHKRFQSHCNDTFYMTNVAPQVGCGFNRDAWNKLECYVRNLVLEHGSVYVCTGPLYMPKRQNLSFMSGMSKDIIDTKFMVEYELIGQHAVAVPTHFYKVIIVESQQVRYKSFMESYLMPNRQLPVNVNLRMFLCDIRDIERASGLKFFH